MAFVQPNRVDARDSPGRTERGVGALNNRHPGAYRSLTSSGQGLNLGSTMRHVVLALLFVVFAAGDALDVLESAASIVLRVPVFMGVTTRLT